VKKLLMILAASAALGSAGTALADPGDNYGGWDRGHYWNNGGDNYGEFNSEYRHIQWEIRRGLNSGAISRWEASRFYRELDNARRDAFIQQRRGWGGGDYVQARLERLHQRLEMRLARGGDRYRDGDTRWNGGFGGYGGSYDHGGGLYYGGDRDDD